MKKYFLAIVLTAITAIIISCGENGVEPEIKTGRRDYVWKADTLRIPFTFLYKMWGDATDNVWAVGPGGSSATSIWRYNGTKWETDNIVRLNSPEGVWGFGKDNVWTCGNEGRIWHNDGKEWRQSICFTKQSWSIVLQEIWGDSPNNIYAVGLADSANVRHALILGWNGTKWEEVKIPAFPTYAFIKIRRAANSRGNYFLLGWGENATGGDLLALFEFDGKNIWKVYEGDFVSETWANVERIGDKLLFIIGNKICDYSNGKFNTILEINIPNYNQGLWGRSEKDIFISMKDGIAHYDGKDIQYIYRYKDNQNTYSTAITENNIFILTTNSSRYENIIIRGKLP